MTKRRQDDAASPPMSSEYTVASGEAIGDILERIRGLPGDDVLLDITAHESLRTDGALRRTLASAAAELGKRLTFSVVGHSLGKGKGKMAQDAPVFHSRVVAPSVPPRRGGPGRVQVTVIPAASSERHSHGEVSAATLGVSLPRLSRTGKRVALTFAFLAGLLTTAAVVFLAPHADVVVFPAVEPVSADLVVRASTRAARSDPSSGVLGSRIVSVDTSLEGTFPVEHRVERGDRAKGTIELVNRTGETQKIRGGSRLGGQNGVVLTMEQSASVPPDGTTTVPVVAEEGGTKGNLTGGELTFVALPPETKPILFGRVTTALTGGTDKAVPQLAESDIRRAQEQLLEQHKGELLEKLRAQRPQDALTDEALVRVRVTEVHPQESLGSEVSEFHLRGLLRGEAFVIEKTHLLALVEEMVLARAGAGHALGKPLAAERVNIENIRWEDGVVDIALHVENVLRAAFDLRKLREHLAGRTPAGAEEYLRALPGVKGARVTVRPFWIHRVPSIPRGVQITIELPDQPAAGTK
jgi:baseplate J-like protein